jgi:hypothetical protein
VTGFRTGWCGVTAKTDGTTLMNLTKRPWHMACGAVHGCQGMAWSRSCVCTGQQSCGLILGGYKTSGHVYVAGLGSRM